MIVVVVRDDPPVRADGLCAVCLKPRDPKQSARYAKEAAELDPFCSSLCARGFHGTSLPPVAKGGVHPKPLKGPVVNETPAPTPEPPQPAETAPVVEPSREDELTVEQLASVSAEEVRQRGYVTFVATDGRTWPISLRPGERTPFPDGDEAA